MSREAHDQGVTDMNVAGLGEDALVATFVTGRDSTDPHAKRRAVEAWKLLVAGEYDRIRGYVATFRVPGLDVRIDRHEIDDAAHAAVERCLRGLLASFHGSSIGELRAAVRTATSYACLDHCRASMREDMRRRGSLDEPAKEGEETGRFDAHMAALGARIEEGRFGATMDIHALAFALDGLANANMRDVLRLTLEGYTSAEIAERLGLAPANVDQLRSRGLRKLRQDDADDG